MTTSLVSNELNATIDRLSKIKTQLKQGNIDSALLSVNALESSLYRTLAILSLDDRSIVETISCDDYPKVNMN